MLSIIISQLIIFAFIGLNILFLLKLFPDEPKLKRKTRSKKV